MKFNIGAMIIENGIVLASWRGQDFNEINDK